MIIRDYLNYWLWLIIRSHLHYITLGHHLWRRGKHNHFTKSVSEKILMCQFSQINNYLNNYNQNYHNSFKIRQQPDSCSPQRATGAPGSRNLQPPESLEINVIHVSMMSEQVRIKSDTDLSSASNGLMASSGRKQQKIHISSVDFRM